MSKRASAPASKSKRQAAADDLLRRARKVPGVAEVIDVYGRVGTYVDPSHRIQLPLTRNATGGNG